MISIGLAPSSAPAFLCATLALWGSVMKKRTSILGYGKLHQRMESRSRAMSRGGSISESLEIIEAVFADLKQRQ